jgi:hypothetical protein
MKNYNIKYNVKFIAALERIDKSKLNSSQVREVQKCIDQYTDKLINSATQVMAKDVREIDLVLDAAINGKKLAIAALEQALKKNETRNNPKFVDALRRADRSELSSNLVREIQECIDQYDQMKNASKFMQPTASLKSPSKIIPDDDASSKFYLTDDYSPPSEPKREWDRIVKIDDSVPQVSDKTQLPTYDPGWTVPENDISLAQATSKVRQNDMSQIEYIVGEANKGKKPAINVIIQALSRQDIRRNP